MPHAIKVSYCDSDHRRNKPSSDAVGQVSEWAPGCVAPGDHLNDLRQQSFAADALRAHHE